MTAKLTKDAIWNISDEECLMISEPLAAIISDIGMSEAMAKYANPLALVMALGIVIAPRAAIVSAKKEDAEHEPTAKPKAKSHKRKTTSNKESSVGDLTANEQPEKSDDKNDGVNSWNLDVQQY